MGQVFLAQCIGIDNWGSMVFNIISNIRDIAYIILPPPPHGILAMGRQIGKKQLLSNNSSNGQIHNSFLSPNNFFSLAIKIVFLSF